LVKIYCFFVKVCGPGVVRRQKGWKYKNYCVMKRKHKECPHYVLRAEQESRVQR